MLLSKEGGCRGFSMSCLALSGRGLVVEGEGEICRGLECADKIR